MRCTALDIHWPTDATLLWDTVRVLSRLIGRLRAIVPKDVPGFPNRKRAARKRMQKLQRMTAAQRESQQVRIYRQLLAITQEVLANARLNVKASRSASTGNCWRLLKKSWPMHAALWKGRRDRGQKLQQTR